MRPHGSPQSLEERRKRGITFLKQKLSLHEIARRIGCNASSVLRWRDALKKGGKDALKAKPVPGRPPKLTSKQKQHLVRLLTKGAMAHGYRTELWTTKRISEVIERQLGVTYHYNHVGKLLHQIGWSYQKPKRRAIERDEEEIAKWKRSVLPRVKKTPQGWRPTSSLSTNRASS
ncbi:MAG TPA: IS630 family transposase [Nitrospiraceae bacterium]|nr:IS630 family transposase [Nitrospiraceae bacterium]